MAERKLTVTILGDSSSLERSFLRSQKAGRTMEATLSGSIGRLTVGFATLAKSVLIVDGIQKALQGLNATVRLGTSEFKENAQVTAQTVAALKSTQGIANVTAKQIDQLGLSLSNLSGVDDEVIRQGENLLLSFTNIRNFAGKNNDIFTQATKVMVDFSIRTGRDAAQSAIILGRALEDPATRVASLSRAGVVFTRQQVNQLKAIEKTQGVLAAQKVLLQELEKRFAGAGKAAGQTLPGQLNILRDRFKDLAGAGVGAIAPALTRAVSGLTKFVVRLSDASTLHARFRIVIDGLQNLGRDIVAGVRDQIGRIKGLDRLIGGKIRDEFNRINWRREITDVARAIGRAIADNLQNLNQEIRRINWNKVGQDITKGVGLAIAAAAIFIKNLDLGRITKAVADVLGAALIAAAKILEGIGEVIGRAVLKGITAGLNAAKNEIIRVADKIALAIIDPFASLPFGIGDPAQRAKEALKKQLAEMAQVADQGAKKVVKALEPVAKPIASRNTAGVGGAPAQTPLPPAPAPPEPPARKGITAAQRNTFFDNAIARILLRGGLGTIQQQIAALQKADDLIAARLKVTKDVTRRLNLEDQLLQNAAQVKSLQAQAAAEALQKRQDARDKALAALTARQFRQLGLGATGEAVVPQVAGLKKRLAQLTENITTSSLNTPKLQDQLTRFRKVLSEGLVPRDVRAKIKEMLDEIDQQLKDHAGDLTKFAHVNSNAILAGLGLSPDQVRKLRERITQIGAGGTVPGQRSIAFAGAGAGRDIVVHTSVNLDGKTVARNTTRHQQKDARTRTSSRRG